jgi:heat shock protein HslJ
MKRFKLFSAMTVLIPGMIVFADLPPSSPAAANSSPTPLLDELKNMTYKGFEDPAVPVALVDGRWEGRPYVDSGASRPTVNLIADLVMTGDLDGNGMDEAVVLLNVATGGTGQLLHLAIVARKDDRLENIATEFIGDRSQIRDARIQERRIILDVVRPGPRDAACCPGEVASCGWTLGPDGKLNPFKVSDTTGRLTLETIGGTQLVLRSWQWNEAAPAAPEVTLAYQDGRFTGSSGCNRYFASVKTGDMPGDVTVGPAGATKMACPEPAMAVEMRFLKQLAGVTKFGFMTGRLMLSYEADGIRDVMLFEKKEP